MGMEGALHHIMWGGLEARDIFRSDTDREDLVKRLNEIVPKSQTVICAWCLMSKGPTLLKDLGWEGEESKQ